MKKSYFLLLLLLITSVARAQFVPLSEKAEISILTIGPGQELYDKFGHSAFRIQDPVTGQDVVFNYGEYDFETPNFYLKFARGKLLYQIGADYFEPFFRRYIAQNRTIKEQVLNFTLAEKQAISDYLWNNLKPENKKYKYDFFFDNCATKIRDVLQQTLGNKLEYRENHIIEELTFRDLIQQNLEANSWGSLGIDVALGAVIDKKAEPIEYQFLPEYIYKGAENAVIHRSEGDESLVKSSSLLYGKRPMKDENNFFLSPFAVLGILGLLIMAITVWDYKRKKRSHFLDFIIFLTTGLIGIFLLLLWFATDHTATAYNYNLLWAFPISILFIVTILHRNVSPKMQRYILLLILLLALLAIHWISGVQVFAITLLPILIALAVRYVFVFYFIGRQNR